MKKLNLAIAVALGLSLPFAAQAADDEVTIRVMQMNENSAETVMNRVNLPDAALIKVKDQATYKKRNVKRLGQSDANGDATGNAYGGENIPGKHYDGEGPGEAHGEGNHYAGEGPGEAQGDGNQYGGNGPGDGAGIGELDRDRIQDQDQLHIMDQDQDRIRDQDQLDVSEPTLEQVQDAVESESGQSEDNQQGPGPQG